MFKKLISALSANNSDYIKADLGRLNSIQKGLGDKAVRYVKTGDGGEVLATLSATEITPQTLFPFVSNSSSDDIYQKRATFFLDANPYDLPLMVRYAEVLEAAQIKIPYTYQGFQTDTRPAFQMFCAMAFAAAEKFNRWAKPPRTDPVEGFTPERALVFGEALGVSPEKVFQTLFWDTNRYYSFGTTYRSLTNFTSVFSAHPEAVLAAFKTLRVEGRVALMKELDRASVAHKEPFLTALFDETGSSAKASREYALKILKSLPTATVEAKAVEALNDGKASVREGVIAVLASIGSETALTALKARLGQEKSAKVKMAIENVFLVAEAARGRADNKGDSSGYQAIDGSWIDIPPKRDLPPDNGPKFGSETQNRLEQLAKDHNASLGENSWGFRWKKIESPRKFASYITTLLNGESIDKDYRSGQRIEFFRANMPEEFNNITKDLSLSRSIRILTNSLHGRHIGNIYSVLECSVPKVSEWLTSEDGDLRVLEGELVKENLTSRLGGYHGKETAFGPGDLAFLMMPEYRWTVDDAMAWPADVVWPYLAEYPAALDAAFGLSSVEAKPHKLTAIEYLACFPKTPMRYLGPLLEMAAGEGKTGRAEARALLAEAPGVDDRLIDLLEDKRQAIRAGAADWLAVRDCKSAIKPLHKRFKKEKSEVAKSALLTALQTLGEDVSGYVGPTALIKEAEVGLQKAKFDKLDWLDLNHLPKLMWGNGKPVPNEVLKWWIFLANKLKQPGGNGLFEIYLDQLKPENAEAFSSWIFDSWVSYDTKQPDDAEGIAYAQEHVKTTFPKWERYMPNLTEDLCFQMLKRQITSQYLNSGAASKGLLGLATRVPAARAADQVRHFLKNHGARTSQAASLLELMAAKGDPVSLQVVIAAATRLKQKGVQAKAGEMIEAVAETHGWSIQELADRTIPTGGLDDDGRLELPCGPMEKLYTAQIGDDLSIILRNPDGKVIKALPSGDDEATKTSKKQLSATKREIKQVIKSQADRLYEGVCAERIWSQSDWQRDFYNHPVMRRLVERVIWLGLSEDGQVLTSFRPTAEGDFTDTEDNGVDIGAFTSIRLAHGALVSDEAGAAWSEHLKDYEVKPLFRQFGRNLMRLPEDQSNANEITDREGWLTDAFNIRGAANKLGYERGEAEDGGWFTLYRKPFKAANLTAVIEFTGNAFPEENIPAALKSLSFVQGDRTGYGARKIALSKVPSVLLSECWNDYHDMAAKAVFDPEWEKKSGW